MWCKQNASGQISSKMLQERNLWLSFMRVLNMCQDICTSGSSQTVTDRCVYWDQVNEVCSKASTLSSTWHLQHICERQSWSNACLRSVTVFPDVFRLRNRTHLYRWWSWRRNSTVVFHRTKKFDANHCILFFS